MFFYITASAAFFAFANPFARAAGRTALSFDEMKYVLDTAATTEDDSDIFRSSTPAAFDRSIVAQWRANARMPADKLSPYLLCKMGDDGGDSGYRRAATITNECRLTGFANNNNGNNGSPVYNGPLLTCFVARIPHAVAAACADRESVTVTPYTVRMKISRQGVADSFRNLSRERGPERGRRYAALFCGPSATDAEADRHRATALGLLEDIWKDGASTCPAGSSSLLDNYDFYSEKNKGLMLHSVDGTSDADIPDVCVLALIESLASNSFVCELDHDAPVIFMNHKARWIIQGSVYDPTTGSAELPLHAAGILGQGQVAQVSDSGLSVGSCYFYDATGAVRRDQSKVFDMTRRKVVQYYTLRDGRDDIGHGTHVAGTVAGKVCPYEDDVQCSTMSDRGGNAPEAKIAVYDICVRSFCGPDETEFMFGTGIRAGAYVHSASWGSPGNTYDFTSRSWDAYLHSHQNYLAIMAAGNRGNARRNDFTESVDNVGKNIISVCASMNRDDGRGENYVADFSGMGWTSDGRMKPDICAPGKYVDSADYGDNRQCGSVTQDGTSMSCPGITGASLLIRQYFMDGWYPSGTRVPSDAFTPTGYLIKAVVLNSGRTLIGRDNGSYVTPSVPYDKSQGFGLISLVDGVYLKGKSLGRVQVFDRQVLKEGGVETWKRTFRLGRCPAPHFSVTLDYYDMASGSTSCRGCIVNRLNLTVVRDGVTYYPNGLSWPDERNNSQRVRLKFKAGDTMIVKVHRTNLFSSKQNFAVVVSGCFSIGSKNPITDRPSSISSVAPSIGSKLSSSPSLNHECKTKHDCNDNNACTW
eukprot:CAMPEP_0194299142 /NCGR_PEP_ID=MMETSP0169-20130528/60561_1 /TAXON_ID=218684 /ORGANISM="Corethron pennatum, Strain L29A3" /LENGTH=812 /DNA_ID=CAMNT_0039049211 /DNA_START=126 /DNA_END=2561 /DNA_ORIENTATION=+